MSLKKDDIPEGANVLAIHQPVIIVDKLPDETLNTLIFSEAVSDVQEPHAAIGLIVCDIVRHAARAFNVDEEDIFAWLDKERDNPTTDVTRIGPN